MLNRFRNASNSIVAKILFGLIILSFVGWGANNAFTDGANETRLAKVGGRDITIQMLDRQMDQDVQRISASFGFQMSKAQAIQFGFTNRVLENLIKGQLLELEAQDIGLRPSEESVFSFVKLDQNFHDQDGNFSADLMKQVLKANNLTESRYFDLVRQDIQKSLLAQAITVPVKTPEIISKTLYQYENEGRNVDLYLVSDAAIGQITPPTDVELQAYYATNSQNYQQPESRSVSVIEISPEQLSKSVTASDAEVKEFYTQNQATFDVPEMKQIDQMIAKSQEAADAIKVALANGGNPTKIAQENDASYVDLKKISQQDMFFPQLGEQTFALKDGEVSAPIQTPIGFIVTKVVKTYPASTPAYANVKAKAKALLLADKMKTKREEVLEDFEDDIHGDMSFSDVAKKYGVNLLTLSAVTQESIHDIKALDKIVEKDQVIEKAFTGFEGEASEVIESRNGSLVAVRVNTITPTHVKSLDENLAQVQKDWTVAQKLDKAIELGDTITQKANVKGGSLKRLATTHKLALLYSGNLKRSGIENAKPDAELSPAILKEIYAQEKVGSNFFDNNGSTYIFRVNKIMPAAMKGYASYKADIEAELAPQLLGDMQDQLVQALSKKYNVELFPKNMRLYIESVMGGQE